MMADGSVNRRLFVVRVIKMKTSNLAINFFACNVIRRRVSIFGFVACHCHIFFPFIAECSRNVLISQHCNNTRL